MPRRHVPEGAKLAPLPRRVRLALCQPSADPPDGDGWVHEVKHDGHRVVAILDGTGGLRLLSRNGYDVTGKFGAALNGLPELGRAMVLDGEIAAPDGNGVTHLDTLTDVIQRR